MIKSEPTQLERDLERLDNEVFSGPERWTQGAWARDENGWSIAPTVPNARCFCLGGGIAVISPYFTPRRRAMAQALMNCVPGRARSALVPSYNDNPGRTFADIKELIASARLLALACREADEAQKQDTGP